MCIIEEIINQINKSQKDFFSKEQIVKIMKDFIKQDNTIIKDGNVIIDLSSSCIIIKNTKKSAARKIIQIAYYLLSNKTKVVTREELLSNIWGDDIIVGERTIDVHVRKLRMLVGKDYVTTVKTVGYQWKQ
jgi:two-component system alkaline phosphatase synthesis response regulator PhoP